MSDELKIKAKTLAVEAKIIRHEEQKVKRRLIQDRVAAEIAEGKTDETRFQRLTVRATRKDDALSKKGNKAAAARAQRRFAYLMRLRDEGYSEEQITRFRQRISENIERRDNLRDHRKIDVRREARATHLTRMFLKGTPLSAVEQKWHPEESNVFKDRLKKIEYMALKYSTNDESDIRQKLSEWLQEGGYIKEV